MKLLAVTAAWILFISLFAFAAAQLFPLQPNYLGGGRSEYVKAPLLLMHANFDGEHYVELVRFGYKPLQYFFFPLYPISIGILVSVIGTQLQSVVAVGTIFSISCFILALFVLKRLLELDYKQNVVWLTVLLMLVFPTSFYFQMVYTESLFLLVSVSAFYFARKRKWLIAGVLALFCSATRLIGVLLLPALLFEWYMAYRGDLRSNILSSIPLLMAPLGLVFYMIFLQQTTGDYMAFYNNIAIFGEQRSNTIILLPQVFFRYVFRILPSATSYWPTLATTLLEFTVGVLFFVLSIISFFKQRGSYSILLIGGYLIPTFAGSFSSMPRYMVVLFPAFILMAQFLSTRSKLLQILVLIVSSLSLLLFCSMFIRGYWVS